LWQRSQISDFLGCFGAQGRNRTTDTVIFSHGTMAKAAEGCGMTEGICRECNREKANVAAASLKHLPVIDLSSAQGI
jgi:hypothetical protein